MRISIKKQRGVFVVELGLILMAILGIYMFMTDLSHRQLARAQLDRTTFAVANILRDRIRFHDNNHSLSITDQTNMLAVAGRMLGISTDSVALRIEALRNGDSIDSFSSPRFEELNCQSIPLDQKVDMVPVELGNTYPIYQVTICEEIDTWFYDFMGENSEARVAVTSSSVVPGR